MTDEATGQARAQATELFGEWTRLMDLDSPQQDCAAEILAVELELNAHMREHRAALADQPVWSAWFPLGDDPPAPRIPEVGPPILHDDPPF
ncbi:hypothetical protein [Nocardia asteroides]|uniref:hypothetical protein n=1 Tax=Nocardia asteroides TaxID=1824 RepID=UPI003407A4E8